jgi:hypothetical protein
MNTRAAALPVLVLLGVLAGCVAEPERTTTQLDAAEVRTLEVPAEGAFAAVRHALTDAGYIVLVADAGILTGEKRIDPGVLPNTAVILLTATLTRQPTDIPPEYRALCVLVRPDGPGRSTLRIRTSTDGRPEEDPGTVREVWALTRQQAQRLAPPGR